MRNHSIGAGCAGVDDLGNLAVVVDADSLKILRELVDTVDDLRKVIDIVDQRPELCEGASTADDGCPDLV